MVETEVVVKKPGSSLGFVIPKEIVEKEHIKENDIIKINIQKVHTAREIWGLVPDWKIDTQKAKDEARKGWD